MHALLLVYINVHQVGAVVESSLLTLADWRAAYLAGADPATLLLARAERLATESPAVAWIHRVAPGALAPRLAELAALAARHESRASLLAAHPLFGVPFAVKDNIAVQGLPTTAACPAFAHDAAEHATVVRRLLDTGAVLLGKTNLDQFATGLVGTRSPYGAPSSVFDAARISGGSSSGSSVAVARGDVAFALGTDTAGSGRVPAAFNQLVGLKPTPGRVSTSGVVPACRSIDCVSVFALTVDDAAAVLATIEGDDPTDAYSRFAPGAEALPATMRIGIPRQPTLDATIGYPLAWQHTLDRARASGATLIELDFEPLFEVAALLYDGPWVAERYAAAQALIEAQPDAMDPTVRAVISRAVGHSAVDAFRGQYRLQALKRVAQSFWQQVDVLLVPSTPRHPTHDEVRADPIGVNAQLGRYTNFVNLLGWSALALPASTTASGLPFGLTLIAPANADAALLRWGQAWQQMSGLTLGGTPRTAEPNSAVAWPATEPTLPIVVVGAHLSGLPLNHQLIERGAQLVAATHTAPHYRFYALPGTTPPKPGLVRMGEGGGPIAVEVWRMPMRQWGSFLAGVPAPLGLGSVELADGTSAHGFLCEAHAVAGARDITSFGGWRAYLASL